MAAPLARGAVHGVGLGASHSHKRPVSISSVRGSSGCAVWSGATATAAATRGVAQRRRPGGVPLLRASAAATTAAASSTATMEHAPSEAARAALFGTAKEQIAEVEAKVTGALPPWLAGSLVVNGGGDYTGMTHMFDGYALLFKARFEGGRVFGSQRFLDTEARRAFARDGRAAFREFATPAPASGALGAALAAAKDVLGVLTGNTNTTDNASVSLHAVGAPSAPGGPRPRLLAVSETPKASYLVDPSNLATAGRARFPDSVKGDLTTAHPTVLRDGRLLNFSRSLPFGGFHIFKQDVESLERREVAFVADRRPLAPAWLHDFPATDDYAVIVEHPLYISLPSLLFGAPRPFVFMDWAPEDGTRVTVVRLDGSEPNRVFTAPPFFVFHYGGVYEAPASSDGRAPRRLVIDMAAYDDPTILNDLMLAPLKTPATQVSRSHYKRLEIPLDGPAGADGKEAKLPAPTTVAKDAAANDFCEFPAINPAYRGRPYRYAYVLSAVRPTNMGNALSKIDVETGDAKTWHEKGAAVGEPLFVAAPGAAAEDDGVVLAPGVGADGRSFVVVLDAKEWREVARAELPFSTPYRFHGIWLEGAAGGGSQV